MDTIKCPKCGKEMEYPRDGNKLAVFEDGGYTICCLTCTHIIRVYTTKDGITTEEMG